MGTQLASLSSLCTPRLRDDSVLTRALAALAAGHHADALIGAEYVVRRLPKNIHAAILRASLLERCRPELAAKAWYRAWCCEPDNPLLQDAMLNAWIASGASASVVELGATFLPGRCRQGTQHSLVAIMRQVSVSELGACWKAGNAIEGAIFKPGKLTRPRARLRIVCDSGTRFEYDVPADGSHFRIPCPKQHGALSLSWDGDGTAQLLQGSPLIFEAPPLPAPVAGATPTGVVLIIPVYRDLPKVRACLHSVLTSLPHNDTPCAVLVIDDASPEPGLAAWLDEMAAAGHINLLRNEHNLGFIKTCNRALRHCPQFDPLLLNADTLVHGNWIDRLRTSLYRAPDIASVTPWSNNGEISSFPKIGIAAPAPTAHQLAVIDDAAAAARREAGADIDVPSCCGFTMLMRRCVLDEIGLLDGIALVRGYGEEVDWCLRAGARGYRHLVATGVFVAHSGTASFRFEKTLRVAQNMVVLNGRYPDFYREYRRLLHDDPLGTERVRLRQALERACPDWLDQAIHAIEGKAELALAVPAALASSCTRIGVWQHRMSATHAHKVLALARLIAGQSLSEPALRLFIIGEASEALWHTGVVDVLPRASSADAALLSDAAMVGLAGCVVILSDETEPAPRGIDLVQIDADFEPAGWLSQFRRARSAHSPQEPRQ